MTSTERLRWAGVAALGVLVSGGGAAYALGCFVTGAFKVSDIRALVRRRSTT